ncbi:hypothetical protein CEP51_006034 [Fusarium floridanum]|uniref:Uncharacterized protein n=1 Tax=Fusarium floridanum TaxID=1325733 RepID=A0A428RU87_9HYPO|nr:hypothetical protein CEP51_006034 [Fusarium floridanum]
MNFQLSEDKAFGDEELQELFNGLETTTPGFIIADDVLIEDEDLVGKNLKDRISEDSGSEDGKLEPEYLNPDHIRGHRDASHKGPSDEEAVVRLPEHVPGARQHCAAIDKGNATKKGMLESKYQAKRSWARIPFDVYFPIAQKAL